MGLRFQRSLKILPGLRLHLSKSGIGVSAGVRGFHVGVDSRKRPYVSAGLPGTGLSMREYGKPRQSTAGGSGCAPAALVCFLILIAIAILEQLVNRR